MKTLLDIGTPDRMPVETTTLVVEVGETYCLLSYLGEEPRAVAALKVLTFGKAALEEGLQQMIGEATARGPQPGKVIVSPAFPQAVLVPLPLYAGDSALPELAWNAGDVQPLHDEVEEQGLVNCYSLPYFLYKNLTAAFPSAVFRHAYTPWLKLPGEETAGDGITAHFVHNVFRVLVRKAGRLQLVQTFLYATPADAVYYLLKICVEWELAPGEVPLVLSGFIEKDSSLYEELYSYFRNLSFARAPGLTLPEGGSPEHYFASLHNLAVCAS